MVWGTEFLAGGRVFMVCSQLVECGREKPPGICLKLKSHVLNTGTSMVEQRAGLRYYLYLLSTPTTSQAGVPLGNSLFELQTNAAIFVRLQC